MACIGSNNDHGTVASGSPCHPVTLSPCHRPVTLSSCLHKPVSRLVGALPSRGLLIAAALVLLHLTHPLTWGRSVPDVWFAPVGIGIALVAWFGPRILWLVIADSLLVALQTQLTGAVATRNVLAGTGLEAILNAAEAWAAWWCYHRLARGSRNLDDPRSATLFLFLVPGLVVGCFAGLRALGFWLSDPAGQSFVYWLGSFWLSSALGVLGMTPFLLVMVTPLLCRLGLVRRGFANCDDLAVFSTQLTLGDCLEIGGLALGTSILGLMLLKPTAGQDMAGWQLWGVPLLLIVWASLRQGLRGGIVVTGSAAVFTLTLASFLSQDGTANSLLQSNVLAQCSTALLVAASATCIRTSEARYRQVVGHIPVVLYSARVVQARDTAVAAFSASAASGCRNAHADVGMAPGDVQITFVSPASLTLLGKRPEELLGDFETWLERVDHRDREVVLAAVRQLTLQSQPVTCEYRIAQPSEVSETSEGCDSVLGAANAAPHNSKVISHPTHIPKDRWVRDMLVPDFGPGGRLEGWQGVVTDITEQRALADDLRRTTSMFHALVANLPAGVFFVQGLSGRPILVNARARQLLGQREDPAAGLDHFSQVYRLYRHDGTPYPVEELPVSAALRRGASCMRDDIVVHRPDGRNVPLVSWAAPIEMSGHGQPDAAVWVLEDLTALHKAEEARRKTEARLRAVIETMAEALIVQDQTGKILECNPAACAILGLGPDQFRGRSLLDSSWTWLREDGRPLPADEHPVRRSCQSGQPVRNVILGIHHPKAKGAEDGEWRMENGEWRMENGKSNVTTALHPPPSIFHPAALEVRWVLVNCMPLALGQDKVLDRVVTTVADITAYRHAQDVLRLSEEKYRGLVESLPLMVVQLDCDGRITYVNPATQAITGYSLDDLPEPAAWQALIAPEDLRSLLANRSAILAGETIRTELHYRAKDGSDKVGHAIIQPRWQSDGEVVAGMTALIVDMTLQRRLEQDLQRSQRLDLVGRLASGIAHDFNNLLSVALTLTELARDNIPPDHPSYANLRRAAEAGEQAAQLAEQLLAFGRQRRAAKRRVDVNAVAQRSLELLRSTLPPSIDVVHSLKDADLCVQADEMQLQQVLMNLCLNARDSMPEGGRLVVRTELADSWVHLSVEDTGQGIAEGIKDKIFDPFFSTKERGTGLGLAVVQQIVENFGGRIEVSSRAGVGSRFDIWLPRDQSQNAQTPEPASEESDAATQLAAAT